AWLETIRAGLPELPAARRERYRASLGLSAYDAAVLVADAGATDLFEATLVADPGLPAKRVANWVAGEYLRLGAREAAVVRPAELAALVRAVEAGQLSTTNAKEVFARHAATGQAVALIVDASGMRRISDETALREAVAGVIDANPAAAADVRAGKGQAARFLVGQVMKRTRGQADAALVQRLVKDALSPPEDG
ncbi:MAG: Asp-tRNA(Asn)/Glu-tRNA(Gln) amidotransferase subunit GatB, partial [Candidatus Limnocylindrales bacterium]